MFRKSNGQKSFFSVETIIPDALPQNDWSFTYRERVLPLIDEDRFRHLFAEQGGAPNKPIKTTVSLLIFMGLEKLTWRAAEFQFPRRLDWLNATGTPIGEADIDFTTLYKFYRRLEGDETARDLFETITNRFVEVCGTSLKKQRTDSFFIHGWLKTLSRYGLFKETIRVFLAELNKKTGEVFDEIAGKLSRQYLEKNFDLTEKDREKAQRRIKEMAQDLYIIVMEFESNEDVKKLESFKTLETVFAQQCKVVETEDNLPTIEIKEKPEGEKIINSPHNTDAEYVRKGNQKVTGHKGFVSETCDQENKTQFITDVNATGATRADSKELPELQERVDKAELKPEAQYGDAGFVNGKTIISSEEKGIDLEGPSSGRSQSIEGFEKEDRPLDGADFKVTIDEETKEITVEECPEGEAPLDQGRSEKTGKVNVHFDSNKCAECPFKERCPVKIGKNVATLTIDESAYAGALRHHQYMGDTDYRKECAIRAGAEGMVNEIANAHGMRRARHRKLTRIKLQMVFAALACNVKRFIRHGDKYAYLASQQA